VLSCKNQVAVFLLQLNSTHHCGSKELGVTFIANAQKSKEIQLSKNLLLQQAPCFTATVLEQYQDFFFTKKDCTSSAAYKHLSCNHSQVKQEQQVASDDSER
jgi:hypothetical protein